MKRWNAKIHVLPANSGDCFLIEFNNDECTHIDKDHIGGAKKLIEENGDYNTPNVIKIENVWFNGFKNLIFQKKLSKTLSKKQY